MEPVVVVCIVFFGILLAILGIAVAVSALTERKEQKRNASGKESTGTITEQKNSGYYCELCRSEKATERKSGVDLCEECYEGFCDVLSGDRDALEKYSNLDRFPDASPNAIKEIISLARNKNTTQKEVVNAPCQEERSTSLNINIFKEGLTGIDEEGEKEGAGKEVTDKIIEDQSIDEEEYYKILGVSESDSLEQIKCALKTKLRKRFSPLKQETYYDEDYHEKLLLAYLFLVKMKSGEEYLIQEESNQNLKEAILSSHQTRELNMKIEMFLPIVVMKVKELINANKIGFGKNLFLGLALCVVGIWMTYESQFFIHNILKGVYTVYYGAIFCGIVVIIKACVKFYTNKQEIEWAEKEMWDKLDI